MLELLKLTRQFGQEHLRFAIETALETGCTDAAAVHHLRSEPADLRSNRYWRTGTKSADWNDIGGRCRWAELGAEFLFQVIAERAEKTPVVLTTNLPAFGN